jgi:chemotaxis protein methyltransferase CheR
MRDSDCVAFLQWALPRMSLHWPGYRLVRGQVCKRIARRLKDLGLADLAAYRNRLEGRTQEWEALAALCTIPISRFYRDRGLFDFLGREVLPSLARAAMQRGAAAIRCWSAGCASGEEPYTLAALWAFLMQAHYPVLKLEIVATDVDRRLLERATRGCYRASSLRELPDEWVARAFETRDDLLCVRDELRRPIELVHADIRRSMPPGPFDLVLCRNLVLTYFTPLLQQEVMQRVVASLRPSGALVVGIHERLPDACTAMEPWPGGRATYRKLSEQRSSGEAVAH